MTASLLLFYLEICGGGFLEAKGATCAWDNGTASRNFESFEAAIMEEFQGLWLLALLFEALDRAGGVDPGGWIGTVDPDSRLLESEKTQKRSLEFAD